MVWGLFPGIYKNVSWESHMLGFFSGIVLTIAFRREGPQMPVYEWMEEEESESESESEGDPKTPRHQDTKTPRHQDTND